MPSNYFDYVIAGGDLTGVIFGAMAAKRGKRVAVVENGEGLWWEVDEGRPTPLVNPWLYGLESSTVIKEVLNEIDIYLQVRNRVVRARPSLQLIGENYRLDIDSPDQLSEELQREFGDKAAVDLEWVRKLMLLDGDLSHAIDRKPLVPPDSWGERRDLAKIVAEFPILDETLDGSPFDRDTVLLPYLRAYQPFFTGTAQSPMSALPFLRVAKGILDGLYLMDEEEPDFRRFFLDVMRQKSGFVVRDAQISGFEVRRGKIHEIVLRGGKDSVGADVVVCNMEARRFLQLIPPESQKEKFHQRILMRRPAGYLYPIVLRVKGERFLEAAGNFMLFDPAWVPQPLVLHVPRSQPASGKENVLLATTWIPGAEFTAQEDYLRRVEARVVETISRIHPFLGDLTIDRRHLAIGENGAVNPGRLTPVYPLVEDKNCGLNDLPLETPYKNVVMASRDLYGGLGLEGAFLGARILADRFLKA